MTFKPFAFTAASFAVACAAVPAEAATIANPGFESGAFSPWTTFATGDGVPRDNDGYRLSGGDDAFEGDFGVVNDVLTTDPGDVTRGITQLVTDDINVGDTYTLSAFIKVAAAETTQSFLELTFLDGNGVQLAQVQSDRQQGDQDFTFVETGELVVLPGTETIRVSGNVFVPAGGAEGDTDFHVFDSFALNVTPVPEPTTAAVGLVGLGLLAARRRR